MKQFNNVMDVLGGYSEELESTIRSLVGVKRNKEVLLYNCIGVHVHCIGQNAEGRFV